mmetsp:Transcript_42016/g.132759  ORF Transcript_42016/g.132759 Transcript_42016/m.132759 type:complete len:320 (+) Transcript_42016:136-1095(+)
MSEARRPQKKHQTNFKATYEGSASCPKPCRKHGAPPKTSNNQAMKRRMLSCCFPKVGLQQIHASRHLACLPNRGCACNQRRQLRILCAPIRLRLADDIEGVLDIKAKAAPLLVDRLHQVRGVQIVRDGRLQVRDDQALPSRLQRLCKHCQHLATREIDTVDRLSVDDQVLNPISRALAHLQRADAELLQLPRVREVQPRVHADDDSVRRLLAQREVANVAPGVLDPDDHGEIRVRDITQGLEHREHEADQETFLHGHCQRDDQGGQHHHKLGRPASKRNLEFVDVDDGDGTLNDDRRQAGPRHLADDWQQEVHRPKDQG